MLEYFNYNNILSSNYFVEQIIGQRGDGKTFGALKAVLKHYRKKGKSTLWLRSTESEWYDYREQSLARTFLDALPNNLTKGFMVETGSEPSGVISTYDNEKYQSKYAIYFRSVSTPHKLKSCNLNSIDWIIYDEALSEKASENTFTKVENFLNLIDSTFRNRENLKVIIISNNTMGYNPFDEYLRTSKNYKKMYRCTYVADKKFIEKRLKTPVGMLIDGTKYGKYSLYNEAKTGYEKYKSLPKSVKIRAYIFTIQNEEKILHFYQCNNNFIYVTSTREPSYKNIYTLTKGTIMPTLALIRNDRKYKVIKLLLENRMIYANTNKDTIFLNDFLRIMNI